MKKETIDVKAIAERWGVTARRIVQLCNAKEIEGACKIGGRWAIPVDAKKPDVLHGFKTFAPSATSSLLPCPVGITSYKEVSSECYYVDKTLMIKDILDEHSKVMLFTRPRRFGKTLAMDMLKTFFERTDEDTSIYFAGREIWSCGNAYRSCQGAYPVIFLSFKDSHQNTWKDMYESLTLSLRNEFKRHANILDSDFVSFSDKAFFKKVLNGEATQVEYQASMGQLSHMLSDAYSSRVVVIIDEYDTPIQQGYNCGYYNEVIEFMRSLFSSALKDNNALEFGILTGILRIAKESLFSGLNNLVVNTILDEKYSQYFGFTEEDVAKMASYYGKSEKLPEIREWYDGYLFGDKEIYNPWSVINYFNNNCLPKAFWSRTSSNDAILKAIKNGGSEMKKSLLSLMQGQPVRALIDTDIIYPEISRSEDSIYSFLMMTGYLKSSEIVSSFDDVPLCNLLIPNKEIRSVFKKEIIDNLSNEVSPSVIRNFQMALKTNDGDALQNTLRQYLLESASAFDVAKENFYHGMMLGLLSIMSDEYHIVSNRESGEGRFDIELIPVSQGRPGILMEFKASENAKEEHLSKLADEALKQIKDTQYATDLKAAGIKGVEIYGIAFGKKKATVKVEHIAL